MPGLPLTGEYQRPGGAPHPLRERRRRPRRRRATEATAPGADAAMARGAARGGEAGRRLGAGPAEPRRPGARAAGASRGCGTTSVVVAVVADERFPPRALEQFARRVGALVAPLVAGGGAATVRALVERELGA